MKPARPATLHEGFLSHAAYRWAWVALALCAGSIVAYAYHEPRLGPGGGTWLGYTLGTIAALLIVVLLWLGVRKRRYRSNLGTVRGWLSFHVYLGLSLLIVATLHTGFHFGRNVHTVAYGLMCLCVASGVLGVVLYAWLPRSRSAREPGRERADRDSWVAHAFDLQQAALALAQQLPSDVAQGVQGPLLAWAETPMLARSGWGRLLGRQPKAAALLKFHLAAMRSRVQGDASLQLQQLLDLIASCDDLCRRIRKDVATQLRLRAWLSLHVPLSLALLGSLIAHIVAVFFYW